MQITMEPVIETSRKKPKPLGNLMLSVDFSLFPINLPKVPEITERTVVG